MLRTMREITSIRVLTTYTAMLLLGLLQTGGSLGLCAQNSSHPEKNGLQKPCSEAKEVLTQTEMQYCAAQEFKQADDELKNVYRKVLERYSKRPDEVARIEKAQRAWVAFRDADVDAFYPKGDTDDFGEFVDICSFRLLEDLTRRRTKELLSFLTFTEGVICSQKPPAEK
jgi:uncharacterized protein YecT (DUF1311 family)